MFSICCLDGCLLAYHSVDLPGAGLAGSLSLSLALRLTQHKGRSPAAYSPSTLVTHLAADYFCVSASCHLRSIHSLQLQTKPTIIEREREGERAKTRQVIGGDIGNVQAKLARLKHARSVARRISLIINRIDQQAPLEREREKDKSVRENHRSARQVWPTYHIETTGASVVGRTENTPRSKKATKRNLALYLNTDKNTDLIQICLIFLVVVNLRLDIQPRIEHMLNGRQHEINDRGAGTRRQRAPGPAAEPSRSTGPAELHR